MPILTLNTDTDQRFIVPKEHILLVNLEPIGSDYIVRVYHASSFYNPIVMYHGSDKAKAERIMTDIGAFLQ